MLSVAVHAATLAGLLALGRADVRAIAEPAPPHSVAVVFEPPPPIPPLPQAVPPVPAQAAAPAMPERPRAIAARPAPRPAAVAVSVSAEPAVMVPAETAPPVAEGPPPPADRDPSPLSSNPHPDYPLGARRMGQEGMVEIVALLDAEGAVQAVELGASSGVESLDRAALEAVRRWRFLPSIRHGGPAAARVTVPIAFRLRNDGRG